MARRRGPRDSSGCASAETRDNRSNDPPWRPTIPVREMTEEEQREARSKTRGRSIDKGV